LSKKYACIKKIVRSRQKKTSDYREPILIKQFYKMNVDIYVDKHDPVGTNSLIIKSGPVKMPAVQVVHLEVLRWI
jgi:hypothetical protein